MRGKKSIEFHMLCVLMWFYSIRYTSLFGSTIWECNPWVRSVFQLSYHTIFDRTRFLQFSQLVRWSGMVSIGSHHRRYHLSGLNGYISCIVSHFMATKLHCWHSKCLCISGTILLITHHYCHLSSDEGNSCMFHCRMAYRNCCCFDLAI